MSVEKQGFRYKRVVLALLALAVVLLSLIMLINFLPAAPGTFSGQMESRSMEEATTSEAVTFTVEGQGSSMLLTVNVALSAGSLSWRVIDPAGEVRAEGAVAAGETIGEPLNLDTVPGEWQVVVEAQAATGEYLIQWQGAN